MSGTAQLGGAVALIGDDPLCKSSTLPSSCELMAESLMLPLLAPATVDEIVVLGLHAVAMSRAAGLWTAIKIVSDVADASAVVRLRDPDELEIPLPPSQGRGAPPVLIGLSSVAAEHDLMSHRLELARDYGRRHGLNRVDVRARHVRGPRWWRPGRRSRRCAARWPSSGSATTSWRRSGSGSSSSGWSGRCTPTMSARSPPASTS